MNTNVPGAIVYFKAQPASVLRVVGGQKLAVKFCCARPAFKCPKQSWRGEADERPLIL